jgi:hypothetical protein
VILPHFSCYLYACLSALGLSVSYMYLNARANFLQVSAFSEPPLDFYLP